jgi:uncharacterized protein YcbX
MQEIGRVASVWRYPVKSMGGEALAEAFLGFSGVYGDRVYAFHSPAAPTGFPYLTAREHRPMLRYRPTFRHADRMGMPPNLAQADALVSGVTPLYAGASDRMVDVETPSGDVLAIDDPRLIELLSEGGRDGLTLSLLRSERALTDCRPVSLISLQTMRQLGEEVGVVLDARRFRANVYVDLADGGGFGEDAWVGRRLRIGAKAAIVATARDSRCKMITLDPDTGQANPEIMRCVAKGHGGTAGVYAVVLVEGVIRNGDAISLLDS